MPQDSFTDTLGHLPGSFFQHGSGSGISADWGNAEAQQRSVCFIWQEFPLCFRMTGYRKPSRCSHITSKVQGGHTVAFQPLNSNENHTRRATRHTNWLRCCTSHAGFFHSLCSLPSNQASPVGCSRPGQVEISGRCTSRAFSPPQSFRLSPTTGLPSGLGVTSRPCQCKGIQKALWKQGTEGTAVDGVSGTSRCFLEERVARQARLRWLKRLWIVELLSLSSGRGLSKPPCSRNGGMAMPEWINKSRGSKGCCPRLPNAEAPV